MENRQVDKQDRRTLGSYSFNHFIWFPNKDVQKVTFSLPMFVFFLCVDFELQASLILLPLINFSFRSFLHISQEMTVFPLRGVIV